MRLAFWQVVSGLLGARLFGPEIARSPLIALVAVLVETLLAISLLIGTFLIRALLIGTLLTLLSIALLPGPDRVGTVREVAVLIAAVLPAAILRISVLKTAVLARAATFRPVVRAVVLPVPQLPW